MAITKRISLTVDAVKVQEVLAKLKKEFGELSARVTGTNKTLLNFSGAISNSERILKQSLGTTSKADQTLLKYDTTLRKLNKALADGTISQKEFDKAVSNASSQYQRAATQSKKLEKNTKDLGVSAKAAEVSFESLTGALTAFGGIIAGNELIQALDVFTDLQSRLKITQEAGEDLATTQQNIIDLALETRTSLSDNGLLYLRLANAVDRTKVSQEELLDIQETVNKAVSLGGSNAAEASGALRQFTQIVAGGFTSGFAQEINSISEQTQGLFDLIVDGLRETSQEFQDLEKSGKIGIKALKEFSEKGIGDLDMLLKAIASQTASVRQEFELVNITFSRAIGNVGTAITDYLGKLDQSIGFTKTFATAINDLALNFENYKKEIDIVVAGLAGFSVVLAGGAIVAIGAFLGSIGLVAAAVGGAAAAFVAFKDEVITFGDKEAKVIDLALASFDLLVDKILIVKDQAIDSFNSISNVIQSSFNGLSFNFDVKGFVNNAIASFLVYQDVVSQILSNQSQAFESVKTSFFSVGKIAPNVLDYFYGFFRGLKNGINSVIGFFVNLKDVAIAAGLDAFNAIKGIFSDDPIESALDKAFDNIKNKPAKDYLGDLGGDISGYFTEAIDNLPSAAIKAFDSIGIDIEDIISNRFGVDYVSGLETGIEKVFDKAAMKAEEVSKKTSNGNYYFMSSMQKQIEDTVTWLDTLLDKWDQITSGFRAGAKNYSDSVKTLGDYTKDLTEKTFKSMEDGLTEFAMTGKDIWKSLADDILREIIRIQIKANIVAPLASLFGGSSAAATPTDSAGVQGNQFNTFGVLQSNQSLIANAKGNAFVTERFAKGGLPSLSSMSGTVVKTPTHFATGVGLMGERGINGEAILPLQRTASGDLGVASTGSGGDISVNIQVINEAGQPVQAVETGRRRNGNQVDIQIALRQQINNAIASGAADSGIKSRFGFSPIGA